MDTGQGLCFSSTLFYKKYKYNICSYFDGLLYVRKRQSNPSLKHLAAMQPDLSQGRADGARGRCQVDA